MLKRIFSVLAVTALLTCNVFAADMLPEQGTPTTSESVSMTIRDITEEEIASPQADIPSVLPINVETKREDGVTLLIKTYEVAPDTDPGELVEDKPVRGNVEYMLREVTKQQLVGENEVKTATDSVTAESTSEKREDLLLLFSEFIDYNQDGFSGKLMLVESSIQTEVDETEGYAYTIKDTREYTCLDRNDPALIPKTVEKNGATLSLGDIKWSGGNENAVESTYSATAYYTGKGYGQRPGSYIVTANYSGEVTKEVPGNIVYNVIYEPIPVPILPESFDWGKALTILSVAAGSLIALVVIVLLVKKLAPKLQFKKKEKNEMEEYDIPPRPVRRKAQGFMHMKRSGGNENG